MTLVVKKIRSSGEKSYYKLVDAKRVNGKVVQKYVGYLGTNPNSKVEVSYGALMPYVERLMNLELSDSEIKDILKKLGIDWDISPITKIILENDRKLKKVFLRLK
ncbi:hypothetical protein [Ferroplasma sp.]|uniref:hypothetical protein n=1 Tax=Ferroplasma sp. TaxID=2591003 RepID=UPI00260C7793|nr:hypothetical protein [Ferroplasma sp.]